MAVKLLPPRPGNANYRIRGKVRGRYINEATGTTDRGRAEAIRIKRERELLDESIFGTRVSRTFEQAARDYVAKENPRGTLRDAMIGRRRQDGSLSPCLVGDFGDRLIATIDQAAVDAVARLRFAGVKPSTLQRDFLTPLITVLRFAARRRWCDVPMLERPSFDDRRKRWATYDEADRLLASAAPHLRPLLLFLMLTGARMAEALELEWSDVDLEERWLVFRGTKRGSRTDAPGEDRGVALHLQLLAVVATLPGEHQGRVFLTDRDRPYADKHRHGGGQIQTGWQGACRRAGIANLRPHDLRHTCSTWLTGLGVHEQVRDQIIGHYSSNMGRRYAHIPRPDITAAIDQLPWRRLDLDTAASARR